MRSNSDIHEKFSLEGKVAVVTGGTGLLGVKHCEAIAGVGGIPVLLDLNEEKLKQEVEKISQRYGSKVLGLKADITNKSDLLTIKNRILEEFGRIDILVNNAARNPQAGDPKGKLDWCGVEEFLLETWGEDLSVGLTGAFLCSQVFGSEMASRGQGVILNIASDLSVIAPDHRIYESSKNETPRFKPISYSVVKAGLVGMTRYLATYWASKGIRVNSLSPGGVYVDQSEEFVQKLTSLIPMKRMAQADEYKSAVLFLISDASSYMTGTNVVMDGGRTCW